MRVLVIAGPNGAGKTTFSRRCLHSAGPEIPFVNGDEIAALLNPDAPDAAARRAGRIALKRMESHVERWTDFAFETTLSGRSYARRFVDLYRPVADEWQVYDTLSRSPTLIAKSERADMLPMPPPGWRVREVPAAANTGAQPSLDRQDHSARRSDMTRETTRARDRFPEGEPSVKNVMIALRQAQEVAMARAEAVRRREAEAARAESASSTAEN